MGDIARRWNEMSDEEKLEELRQPVITRAFGKPRGKVDLIDSFEKLVVSVRKRAMGMSSLVERAELCDRTWAQLKVQFQRRGIAPDFAEVVRRCFVSETTGWHWFGRRLTWPPGEGE
jgi:hypothetical protein